LVDFLWALEGVPYSSRSKSRGPVLQELGMNAGLRAQEPFKPETSKPIGMVPFSFFFKKTPIPTTRSQPDNMPSFWRMHLGLFFFFFFEKSLAHE
jgi:hypothetical protein